MHLTFIACRGRLCEASIRTSRGSSCICRVAWIDCGIGSSCSRSNRSRSRLLSNLISLLRRVLTITHSILLLSLRVSSLTKRPCISPYCVSLILSSWITSSSMRWTRIGRYPILRLLCSCIILVSLISRCRILSPEETDT